MIRIWPWSRFAQMSEQITALASERRQGWQEIARLESERDAAAAARSAHSTRSAATRRAKVMRKAEEMRGEGL